MKQIATTSLAVIACVALAILTASANAAPASFVVAQKMDANGPWLRRPDGSLYRPPVYRGETATPVKNRRLSAKKSRTPRR